MGVTLSTISKYSTAGVAYCAEYTAIYNAMTNKPNSANAGYQNTLVKGLVDGGYWTSRMDLFYVFAVHTNNAGEAFINWVNPGTFNISDPGLTNPTFTAYEGFTGDGSSDYLLTSYSISVDKINVSQNSITFGAYSRTNVDGNYVVMGSRTVATGTASRLFPRTTPMLSYLNAGGGLSTANSTSLGLCIGTRTSSTAQENYMNGSSLGSGTAETSSNPPTVDIFILAYNYDGTPTYYFPGQVSIVFIMNGVTDAEVTAIYNLIQAYMTSIGKQV